MDGAPIRTAEFFAGIGLVREALEPLGVEVVWANDILITKYLVYAANHADAAERFVVDDIRLVKPDSLPEGIELATSSFPCVGLSLAGGRRGLAGEQSGMFWHFARVLEGMQPRPAVVLLENVLGFATSHWGRDLTGALRRLAGLGYSLDVLTVDARHFVPQSRPRLFIVGVQPDRLPPAAGDGVPEVSDVRPAWVRAVFERHHGQLDMHHLPLPALPDGPCDLTGVLEDLDAGDRRWWAPEDVQALVDSLSDVQRARFEQLHSAPTVSYRAAYRRGRQGSLAWELRRDGIAGCLRTTGGGSSRQALVMLGRGRDPMVRWMTPREYAALMGADGYALPGSTPTRQLFGLGDAVVVDVVRWIGQHYLMPVLRGGAR